MNTKKTEHYLNIAFLSHPQPREGGDWLHRYEWPARALSDHAQVHIVQTTHPDWLKISLSADILIIVMMTDLILLDIIQWRRLNHRITIYEISDDFTALQENNAQQNYYNQKHIQTIIEQLANISDALQFSSYFLQEKFHYLNKNHIVFENQLPLNIQQKQKKIHPHSKLIIGWSGSSGHYNDIKQLIPYLKSWRHHKDVEWHIMASSEIQKLFRKSGLKIKSMPTGSMENYLNFLHGLDICLIWVGDDDFSRGRSDGKFLEAASQATAVLCRYSTPYKNSFTHEFNGLFFKNEKELHVHLNRLLEKPLLAEQLGEAAQNYVLSQRQQSHGATKRFQFYQSLTDAHTAKKRGFSHVFLPSAENKLYEALVQHRNGAWDEALESAIQVMECNTHTLLLWQLLADICSRLGKNDDAQLCQLRASEWLTAHFE